MTSEPYIAFPVGQPSGAPDRWNVKHPDGRALRPVSYPKRDQAEALARLLNEAFELGRKRGAGYG